MMYCFRCDAFVLQFRLIVVVITLGLYVDESALDNGTVMSELAVVVEGSGDDGSGSSVQLPDAGARTAECRHALQLLLFVHGAMLVVLLMLEVSMARLALRGTMWNTQPRNLMEYILYSRLRMHSIMLLTHSAYFTLDSPQCILSSATWLCVYKS